MDVAQPAILGIPWMNLAWTALFTLVGLVLMLVSVVVFDWLTPFPVIKSISSGVQAAGWVVAGLLASTGIIMHGAMRANSGLLQAVIYSVLGIGLNYVGYFVWELLTPNWSLNDAIAKDNVTAGVICCGLFVAIGLIVAGAYPI